MKELDPYQAEMVSIPRETLEGMLVDAESLAAKLRQALNIGSIATGNTFTSQSVAADAEGSVEGELREDRVMPSTVVLLTQRELGDDKTPTEILSDIDVHGEILATVQTMTAPFVKAFEYEVTKQNTPAIRSRRPSVDNQSKYQEYAEENARIATWKVLDNGRQCKFSATYLPRDKSNNYEQILSAKVSRETGITGNRQLKDFLTLTFNNDKLTSLTLRELETSYVTVAEVSATFKTNETATTICLTPPLSLSVESGTYMPEWPSYDRASKYTYDESRRTFVNTSDSNDTKTRDQFLDALQHALEIIPTEQKN